MLPVEFKRMYDILASFLGEAKSGYDGNSTSFEFACPHCIEKYGEKERTKYNLSLSLDKQVFQCWKCTAEDDTSHGGMHGRISKLIRAYGTDDVYSEYMKCLDSFKTGSLYTIPKSSTETSTIAITDVELPSGYHMFKKGKYYPSRAMKYLNDRGIGWDIINRFNIGFTGYSKDNKIQSNRIIIPSYNNFGEINYWTGRDFTGYNKRQKYFNLQERRKDIIFNEEKVQWDADITLVEGPFDHIVVPNSIPLLSKVLNSEFKLYWALVNRAKANINIFVDGDAFENAKIIYNYLNHGRLYGKIRYIPVGTEYDPSLIYQLSGYKGIAMHLAHAVKLKENL